MRCAGWPIWGAPIAGLADPRGFDEASRPKTGPPLQVAGIADALSVSEESRTGLGAAKFDWLPKADLPKFR